MQGLKDKAYKFLRANGVRKMEKFGVGTVSTKRMKTFELILAAEKLKKDLANK